MSYYDGVIPELKKLAEEMASVLIPLQELFKLNVFKDKGNFTVKKDGRDFCLVTPRGDSPIMLRTGIEKVFTLL